jgi:hypothetical protein
MRDDVDGGLAVAESPKRSPTEIAADAAARSDELRRVAYRENVEAWRSLVFSIASGEEPSGESLAAIAELAARLKLPEGSLAAHVAAVTQERQTAAGVARAWEIAKKAEERAPLLGKELEAARRRVSELEAEAERNFYEQADPGFITQRLNDFRSLHPLLFLDTERLVEMEAAR